MLKLPKWVLPSIGEVVLAIETGARMLNIGRTIHQTLTLAENTDMTADVAQGSCTDLSPART